MVLLDRRGQPVPSDIEVVPLAEGARMAKVAGFGVGGLVLGVASAAIPPHFPQLVLIPAAGLFLALHFMGQKARIGAVHAACSKCQGSLDRPAQGQVWSKDAWIRCPACQEPFRIDLQP